MKWDIGVVKLKRIIINRTMYDSDDETDAAYLTGTSIPNVIAIEKLVPLTSKNNNHQVIFDVSWLILNTLSKVYKDGMTFGEAVDVLRAYAKEQYKLDKGDTRWEKANHVLRSSFIFKMPIFKTIYNLFLYKHKTANRVYWDIHEENLMMRPSGEIVLTDPFV